MRGSDFKSGNLTMLCDFYELTMGNAYFANGMKDDIVYFDLFFRTIPEEAGFAIVAGLEQAIDYMRNIEFSEEDIAYLRGKGGFCEGFLEYLRDFKFTCDVWAIPEGTPVFPNEPLVTVRGPVIEAHLLETMLLVTINHQTLIATKASRIVRAAKGRAVLEFGSRRAQGYSGALLGARAAYIGGCIGSSCTLSEQLYGVPAVGTMSHAWVQMFDNELEAFTKFAEMYPDNPVLLVDTYDVLGSGVPNAIEAFNRTKKRGTIQKRGIRIDSGDIAYLAKNARRMLDIAGYTECTITASNSLDEKIIRDLLLQEAPVDSFGVGERLITSKSEPVLGGVYKLVAREEVGEIVPKIKISENVEKITTPHFKKLYRFYDKETKKAVADLLCVHDEEFDETQPYMIKDHLYKWRRKQIENYTVRRLHVPIFEKGELVYECPTATEIRAYSQNEIENLWEEMLRFENPYEYTVNLSDELWDVKESLMLLQGGNRDA